MADNTTLNTGTGGDVIATDDCSGVKFQRMKLNDGTPDSTDYIAGDSRYGLDVDVSRLPNGLLDTFSKIQTVSSLNEIDVQFFRDDPSKLVTVTTASGGSATRTTGLMQLATSTATTGEVKAVSVDRVYYRSGSEMYAVFSAAWLDGGAADSFQRVGLYDDNNGFYIGYEGTTFGVVIRSGGVDGAQTARASFNGDPLDGTSGSRFTRAGTPEAIDLTKLNVFRIRFGWLGAAPIKFEVLSPDGEWIVFHTVRQPNLSAAPSIQSVDLPITAHLDKTAGSTNLRLNCACWGAGSTYDKTDIVGTQTLGTAVNSAIVHNVQGVGTLQMYIGTTTTGTIAIEATIDGQNWLTHPSNYLLGDTGLTDTVVGTTVTPTAGDVYRMQCTGFRAVRVRTATTLGATVAISTQGDAGNSMVNISGGITGSIPHDSPETGNPVGIGGVVVQHGEVLTPVTGGDRTRFIANADGIPFHIGGHPNIQSTRVNVTGAVTNSILVTGVAGQHIVVTGIQVTLDNASTVFPLVRIGFGASTPTGAGVIASHPGVPAGGGFGRGDGSGIIGVGGAAEDLRVTTVGNAGGNGLDIVITYYAME